MRHPSSSSGAAAMPNKATPCCSKVGLKRGPWTPEEDELLSKYIGREGEGRWRTLPKRAGLLRCGKSCRLRWMNYLRPSVKRGHIAPDEEDLILRLHRLLGNRWSLIAGRIPGRTDNEIKNYWNTHLSKKLISQGIDPRTHKPLNPNPNSPAVAPPAALPPRAIANPNPNPESSVLEDKAGCSSGNGVGNNEYNASGADLDGNKIIGGGGGDIEENWQNSEGLMVGNGNSIEDDDMEYCTDDVFSSFLNSLMNEDMFMQQQQQQQNLGMASDLHEVSPVPSFGFGAVWEAPAAGVSNEGEQHVRFDNNLDKGF
ncbi:hypothetical protein ACLOJK_021093 [Asimina triloba]